VQAQLPMASGSVGLTTKAPSILAPRSETYKDPRLFLTHSATPQTLNIERPVTGHDFSRAAAVTLVFRNQVRGAAAIQPSFETSQHLEFTAKLSAEKGTDLQLSRSPVGVAEVSPGQPDPERNEGEGAALGKQRLLFKNSVRGAAAIQPSS
jgi:hypothetical protein